MSELKSIELITKPNGKRIMVIRETASAKEVKDLIDSFVSKSTVKTSEEGKE